MKKTMIHETLIVNYTLVCTRVRAYVCVRACACVLMCVINVIEKLISLYMTPAGFLRPNIIAAYFINISRNANLKYSHLCSSLMPKDTRFTP